MSVEASQTYSTRSKSQAWHISGKVMVVVVVLVAVVDVMVRVVDV